MDDSERDCPACGNTFVLSHHRQVYCSSRCKKRMQNHRSYLRHRETIIAATLNRRKQVK